MGLKHSKRSLDMAENPAKSEIEGVGNAGRLEKIVDGIVEKVGANGHVDGELQNGAEPLHNGLDNVQNGEVAAVALDETLEKVPVEAKNEPDTLNPETEEKVNDEIEEKVVDPEEKEDKKDKKKDKKEKVVKKKFSLRSFSFSKKDKSKPKEEKTPDTKDKTGIEESPEAVDEAIADKNDESKELVVVPEKKINDGTEVNATEDAKNENLIVSPSPVLVMAVEATSPGAPDIQLTEKTDEKPTLSADDLPPPPLPASPPPTEGKETVIEEKEEKNDVSALEEGLKDMVMEKEEGTTDQVLITTEQIEEKATGLLKEVEEKVDEIKVDTKITFENENKVVGNDIEAKMPASDGVEVNSDTTSTVRDEDGSTPVEFVSKVVSSVVTLSSSTEDATDKHEEFGAGESLAEIDGPAEPTITANEVAVVE